MEAGRPAVTDELKLEKVEGNKYHFARDHEAVSSNGNRYLPDALKNAMMDNMKFNHPMRGPHPWMDEEPKRKPGRPKKYKLNFDRVFFPRVRRGRHNYRDELGQFKKAPSLREIMMSTDLRRPIPDLFTMSYMQNIPASVMHDRAYGAGIVVVDEVAEYEHNMRKVEGYKASLPGEPWHHAIV